MFVILFLNGREWCELWNKGAARLQIGAKFGRYVGRIGFVCVSEKSNFECCYVLKGRNAQE
jgi:hypothetical protein